MGKKEILKDVNSYYTEKVTRFGNTPQGVDWNGEESQFLRFEQLTKVIVPESEFSILDYGCGFGSLYQFLKSKDNQFQYTGYDISEEMIVRAHEQGFENANWTTNLPTEKKFDYVVGSGIFNVRLENSDKDWLKYILNVLKEMNDLSEKGFSFNMLTKYSDKDHMRDYLYYADPAFIFDHCKMNFSKHVALLHDYPLYEFSILVRKTI
ncbi:MAG: hypothetical protein JWO06_2708 [Bacteroidota bacterium]|nr:hypothetical protein [Bacteroidota bacterium]